MPSARLISLPFTLAYDPADHLLLGAWAGTTAPDADLQANYADLLAAARVPPCCRFWLLDMRGRHWHSPAFARWFSQQFAPTLRAALGGPTFIAYVLSPALHQFSAESPATQATQRICAAHEVYPFFFETLPAARAWLGHQRALDAAA